MIDDALIFLGDILVEGVIHNMRIVNAEDRECPRIIDDDFSVYEEKEFSDNIEMLSPLKELLFKFYGFSSFSFSWKFLVCPVKPCLVLKVASQILQL